jgi:predicted transcriptional regulator
MSTELGLANYDKARAALERAWKIDEVQTIRDDAQAAMIYAKQAKDPSLMFMAAEIKLRAERRTGEILTKMKAAGELGIHGGGQLRKLPSLSELQKMRKEGMTQQAIADKFGATDAAVYRLLKNTNLPTSVNANKLVSLASLGINKTQSHNWQDIAAIPEKKFESFIAEAKKEERVPTTNGILTSVKEKLDAKEEREREAKRNLQRKAASEKVHAESRRLAKMTDAELIAEDAERDYAKKKMWEKKYGFNFGSSSSDTTHEKDCYERFCKAVGLAILKDAFRTAAKQVHSDKGGDDSAMATLNRAWKEVQNAIG